MIMTSCMYLSLPVASSMPNLFCLVWTEDRVSIVTAGHLGDNWNTQVSKIIRVRMRLFVQVCWNVNFTLVSRRGEIKTFWFQMIKSDSVKILYIQNI